MWDKWQDLFMGLCYAACIALFVLLGYMAYWGVLPTRQLGYHISEQTVNNGTMKYYSVVMVRQHASDRTVYSTHDFNEATRVMEMMKTLGEAE